MAQFDKHQLEKNDQQLFTDSFNFCWELLKRKEYYLSERETNIFSKLSFNYGHDMYDAIMIIMDKIIKSNEHEIGSIKNVAAEATRDSGYDDNSDQLNQQQQQQKQQVDINNSHDNMILKKRKIPVNKIHSNKKFKTDNKKNNCDDSSNAKNVQVVSSNENSIEKLHIIDGIEKEEELFTEQSITIKDEMLPVTDGSIDIDKINNSHDHSIGLKIKSNEISNLFENNHQSCSNKVIKNVDYQKHTRIRTGSLAPKKYSAHTEEDDDLSSTTDENYFDADDNVDVDDDADDDNNDNNNNSLNQSRKRESKIKITNEISFEEKKRVLKLATENPNWSLDLLREQSGCKNIYNYHQIEVWEKHIEQGGSYREKMNCVNNWVINKCIENQKKGEIITNEKIKKWGLEAKKIFKPIQFSASHYWLFKLKKNHEITGKRDNLKINCNLQKKKSSSYLRVSVPYDIKVKVVNLANKNSHWSLKMLREESGCKNLETMNQLKYWKEIVRNSTKKRTSSLSTEKT